MLSSTGLLKYCKCHRQVMKKKQNCWSSINTMHSTLTFYAEMLLHDDVGTSMTQQRPFHQELATDKEMVSSFPGWCQDGHPAT